MEFVVDSNTELVPVTVRSRSESHVPDVRNSVGRANLVDTRTWTSQIPVTRGRIQSGWRLSQHRRRNGIGPCPEHVFSQLRGFYGVNLCPVPRSTDAVIRMEKERAVSHHRTTEIVTEQVLSECGNGGFKGIP